MAVEVQWKYELVREDKELYSDLQRKWRRKGQLGWELVSVVHDGEYIYGYFKAEMETWEKMVAVTNDGEF